MATKVNNKIRIRKDGVFYTVHHDIHSTHIDLRKATIDKVQDYRIYFKTKSLLYKTKQFKFDKLVYKDLINRFVLTQYNEQGFYFGAYYVIFKDFLAAKKYLKDICTDKCEKYRQNIIKTLMMENE